jgi:two-component system sensor histidine kinase DesK
VLEGVGTAVFAASYVVMVLSVRRWRGHSLNLGLLGLLLGWAVVLTVHEHGGWGFLFIYCAAGAVMVLPPRLGVFAVVGVAAVGAVASAASGAAGAAVVGFVASSVGIGLLILVLRDLRMRNQELTRARAELAELAVARERERFARDLHDLLGHSLSVIALKAELAGRLVTDRPVDAGREIGEVEAVARKALGEVREAVSGYRQPKLQDELAGARVALSAAGIEVRVDGADVALEPEVEAVLAWAVREGATNVIRHSQARHCVLRVQAGLDEAGVEVVDDGVGSTNGSAGGSGLAGLAERARDLGGVAEAGAASGGGYRLAVSVPRAPAPDAG